MASGPPTEQLGGDSGSGAPHGATSSDEPAVTPEAGSIPADTEAAVAESEPGVDHADRNTAEIVVPDDRAIGEEAILESIATTTYLIGCPRVRRPDGEEVDDAQFAAAPSPAEPDAPADRRVIAEMVGGRGIEHDEGGDAVGADVEPPGQVITIPAIRGDVR
jgi:hypothetical protein